jgi:hypothetical protein
MHIDITSSPTEGDPICSEQAGSPPAEALFAMRVAGEIARRLHNSGHDLRFSASPSPGRVEVLLCDVDGVVSRMTASRAQEIATGSPLPRRGRDR